KEDLLILKELQVDATRSFVEIAEKLKLNYKMLSWHYKTHVLQRSLISGYYLRWMGTTYSTVLEKALHRRHRYQQLALLAVDLNEVQRMTVMARVHEIPFLWSEMLGEGSYCAQFFFPTENITDAYQFLTAAVAEIKGKVLVMPLDQTEALAFTFSHQLFDGKKWVFNEEQLASRFDALIQKIEEIGGQ
ncbi:MAG: AsnC family protein, partial [Thaumarchaeota archaeon]|nr:AsnC family protein [Nitrososphaerota archaeon]